MFRVVDVAILKERWRISMKEILKEEFEKYNRNLLKLIGDNFDIITTGMKNVLSDINNVKATILDKNRRQILMS